jgi:hypothetical protein
MATARTELRICQAVERPTQVHLALAECPDIGRLDLTINDDVDVVIPDQSVRGSKYVPSDLPPN